MSQPDIQPEQQPRSVVVSKPKSDIYTALLGIAALALAFGCVLLFLEVLSYAGSTSISGFYEAIRGPS